MNIMDCAKKIQFSSTYLLLLCLSSQKNRFNQHQLVSLATDSKDVFQAFMYFMLQESPGIHYLLQQKIIDPFLIEAS